jgi:hypothetical protein
MNNLYSNIKFVDISTNIRGTKAAVITLAAFFAISAVKAQGNEDRQQLWLISTRSAALSGDLQSGQKAICCWRFSSDGKWQTADEESLHAGDSPVVPTTIIIHGNHINADDAIEFAWPIYCRMLHIAKDRPFRLVVWSWPSEQMFRRNRPDVQLKFCYCDAQAYYLGACIKHIKSDVPICLIGYSMGARIAAGGLQLLAGGDVACRTLPGNNSTEKFPKRDAAIRLVMVAAAIDNDSLAPGGKYDLALSQVESMLVVRNGCDNVLKWYPKIYGRRGPEALGYVGLSGCGNYEKIELLDVSCEVGKEHHWESYLKSCSLIGSIDRFIFSTPTKTETSNSNTKVP